MAAQATTKLHLGLNVTNPGTREPTVTASAFATLQDISGGGVVMGIRRGDSARRTVGLQPVEVAEIQGQVGVIPGLIQRRKADLNDKGVGLTWVTSQGAPWRPVPVYVAGYGPRVLAIAGRVADGVVVQLADPEIVEWIVGQVRGAAEEAGRDPSEIKVMACAPAHVSADIA